MVIQGERPEAARPPPPHSTGVIIFVFITTVRIEILQHPDPVSTLYSFLIIFPWSNFLELGRGKDSEMSQTFCLQTALGKDTVASISAKTVMDTDWSVF